MPMVHVFCHGVNKKVQQIVRLVYLMESILYDE
jgi:hypothetical protein